MGRRPIISLGIGSVLALAMSGCGSSSGPLVGQQGVASTSPNSYLMSASDASWYVFIQVQNGVGTADSVAYSSAANLVGVDHGSVTLSNGLMTFSGIANISFLSGGCTCQYQVTGSALVVSLPTTSGLQQADFEPASVTQYNADVQALDSEQTQAADAAASQSAAAAQAAASASAAAAAQAQAILSNEQVICKRVGGSAGTSFGDFTCGVSYVSPGDGQTYQYSIDFDGNGDVIPDSCSDDGFSQSNDCNSTQETVAQARTDCLDGSANGEQGYWHATTDICSV